jgi:zinc protease
MFQEKIEEKVKNLTVEDVNKAIKTYFKDFKDWSVVNAGDYENFEIKKKEKKVDD